MTPGIGTSPAGVGSMHDVEARISSIRARIDGLVGGAPGRVAPGFDLATANAAAEVDLAPATELRSATPLSASDAQPATAFATAAPAAPAAAPPIGQDSRGSVLASRLPEHGRHLAGAIEDAAVAAGIEPSLLAALVRHESNFDQGVVSHAGAIGLAQLMPGTAAGLGVNPHDPLENLAGGARYLREQLDRFGSPELALAAYNAGPNRVAQAGGIPRIHETQTYVGRVMSTWEQLR